MSNAYVFLKMYDDVMRGQLVQPRGQPVREAEDYMFTLDMNDSPLTSFNARKLNLDYAKAETVWYLRGDRFDTFIESKASMWQKIKQPEGFYYSNYGHYLFEEGQIYWVIDELIRDKDSRRASCVLLQRGHMFQGNTDMVCTYSLNFRIRQDRLNMSVNMRSNDAIFGTTNDVFSFAMIYKMVLAYLREVYPSLQAGTYTHKVDSLHIYERHWAMVEDILLDGMAGYYRVDIPPCMPDEAYWLLNTRRGINESPQGSYRFARWLLDC
jgi:thymidylate synthase